MKYLVSLSYDGSKFNGFQRLNNEITVQGELERVLTKLNKEAVIVKGAGRTDKGAHALDQKCHFNLDLVLEPYNLMRAVNDLINKSIRINDCKIIEESIHARFSVTQKEYFYIVNNGNYDAIHKDYMYNYNYKLDINSMKKAAKIFVGYHSFEKFVSGKRDNYDLEIKKVKIHKIDALIYFEFVGKSFYKYMIRNLVGALLEVGRGNINLKELKELMENKPVEKKYSTVPACGLYLKKIDY